MALSEKEIWYLRILWPRREKQRKILQPYISIMDCLSLTEVASVLNFGVCSFSRVEVVGRWCIHRMIYWERIWTTEATGGLSTWPCTRLYSMRSDFWGTENITGWEHTWIKNSVHHWRTITFQEDAFLGK